MQIISRRSVLAVIVLFVLFCSMLRLASGAYWSYHWSWETATRFRNIQSDTPCDSFPYEHLSRIQIVLKIGASEPQSRLQTQLSTVTRCISNLLIFSDHESELNGHHVYDILATIPESFKANTPDFEVYRSIQQGDFKSVNRSQAWRLDRFKFLPTVERSYELNPAAKWFVFLESDTYIVWDNLFRLLDQFDSAVPLYFGSPTRGRGSSYFAYGGTGFVLSVAAVERLVARTVGSKGEYVQPSLIQRYESLIKDDCCGDSVLGWALYKSGVKLSGLWPMFNPHPLHGVPFHEAHWCQPVISMHKLLLKDMHGLTVWEKQRGHNAPLLYADLFEYTNLTIRRQEQPQWDNSDWGGWREPPSSPAHKSVHACRVACNNHENCYSYTYSDVGYCIFVPTMRLGSKSSNQQLSAGWDVEKIKNWQAVHKCKEAEWVKPSTKRIY
ncbi:hypothetical protein BDV36DRAFT_307320 [Aspergillus pseudocaelatus]|uniref:N-acetylgalactosaminide beta-1,3-galactosyltransferase n=1 Tax=Aspergillus pseudocaelatus TaxID=1825620 RepID=A0ABQ6WWF6_9EURO|nr:hypothetical protein BDV36DRAFT_307320 [Aspergillus pseudocaelatus]